MKRIAIGSDHAGYDLKQHLISFIEAAGHTVDDQGTHSTESVDYPEICAGVGRT
ncbi:MAG: ribose 5-phosphate isomerase B, partial [Ilumatobacter sp.]